MMMDGQCGDINNNKGPPTNGGKHTQWSNMNSDKGPPPPPPMNDDEDQPPPCTNGNKNPAPSWTNSNEATLFLPPPYYSPIPLPVSPHSSNVHPGATLPKATWQLYNEQLHL